MSVAATWKMKGIFKADAQKVYGEIASIDTITPDSVVEKATDENSELHKCFTWDDTKAAHKWRRQEARNVMNNLVVIINEETEHPTPVKLVVNVERGSQEYKPIKFVMRNQDEYAKLVERAKEELKAVSRKYKDVSEYSEIFELIDKL